MGMLPRRMRKNPVSAASASPSFRAMIDRINEVKAGDVKKLSATNSASPALRLSLATFLEEWTESDVGHEKYIDNLLSGFDQSEAIKMGDLLEWMAIGTDSQFDNEVSLPKGVDHTELIGLHAELLDFLPLKSYNTFTMVTLLEDDPELVEEVFNNYVELTATEHDALQALTSIVKRGSIEAIRLFLEASPRYEEQGYGFTQSDNYGSLLVDTFELCRRASVAYKKGNYMGAKALLDQIYDEKGIDPQLVRMDLSKLTLMKLMIGGPGGNRGPGDLVLVSPMYSSLDRDALLDAESSKAAIKSVQNQQIIRYDYLDSGKWGAEHKFKKVANDKDGASVKFTINKSDKGTTKEQAEEKADAKLRKLLERTKVTLEELTDDEKTYHLTVQTKKENNRSYITKIISIVDTEDEGYDDDDDDSDDSGATEGKESTKKTPTKNQITDEQIIALVREHGFAELTGGGNNQNQGGNNNNKAKPMGCDVVKLMNGLYGANLKQGSSATFLIHAVLKAGSSSDKFEPSADLVPKGTVTFTTNRKITNSRNDNSGVIHGMSVDMLDSHQIERKNLVRERIDPLRELITETKPETRRNPSPLVKPESVLGRKSPHRYKFIPATMKKYRKDVPWVSPGQTMHGMTVESFRTATRGIPGQNIHDNELYFDRDMAGRGNDIDVYVEEDSRFNYIGTIREVRKLGESPKNNPVRDYEGILHHGDGPYNTQTQARAIAKIMAERGEDVFMWQVHLPKDSTYGFGDGWMVSQDHPTFEVSRKSEVRTFPASSKPMNNPKGGGKKGKSASGNTYAIDLIPRSSVTLTAKTVKFSNKLLHQWRDTSPEMKAFWKKYTATGSGGGNTVYVADKKFVTSNGFIRMKAGQKWNPNKPPIVAALKDELQEMLKTRNRSVKDWVKGQMRYLIKSGKLVPQPGRQQTKQTGDSYVTYKGGKVSMRMILAKHKKSGSFVPFRLLIPSAAFRMEGDTLVPRTGSADTEGAKQLLELIQQSFGYITFHKNKGKGGQAFQSKGQAIKIDEGVAKIFKTSGLEVQPGGEIARPYLYDENRLTYIAKGRQYTMELF